MKLIMAALIAASAVALSSPALAKRAHSPAQAATGFAMTNDGHYAPAAAPERPEASRYRHHRTSRHASGKPRRPVIDDVGNKVDTSTSRHDKAAGGSGVIRSGKTGATAHVASAAAPKMQAMIDDLEQNHGATIHFIGGWRRGLCSLGSQHPCGWAMDLCQLARGLVAEGQVWHGHHWPDCHLPSPDVFHKVARAHGLYEGSIWNNTDYGHVQFKDSGSRHAGTPSARGRYATMTGKMAAIEQSARKESLGDTVGALPTGIIDNRVDNLSGPRLRPIHSDRLGVVPPNLGRLHPRAAFFPSEGEDVVGDLAR